MTPTERSIGFHLPQVHSSRAQKSRGNGSRIKELSEADDVFIQIDTRGEEWRKSNGLQRPKNAEGAFRNRVDILSRKGEMAGMTSRELLSLNTKAEKLLGVGQFEYCRRKQRRRSRLFLRTNK